MEQKTKIKFGSLFDGAGTVPFAAAICGAEAVWASEIEPFPIAVTKKRFPNMKHLGDITKINGAKIEPVDVISFGSPCFPAGTMVLSSKGYVPIEGINVGDKVLTHTGKWQKVTAVGSHESDTLILKGRHYGLECTPNHPIYSAKIVKHCRHRGVDYEITERGEWVAAESMAGRCWATPNRVEPLPIPMPSHYTAKCKEMPEMNENFWYFVGRWLGDGWVRNDQRCNRPKGQTFGMVCVCDGYDKKDELVAAVAKVFDRFSVHDERTAVHIKTNSKILCEWLVANFGKGSGGKFIAPWVFGIEAKYRESLLKGILDSDGHRITAIGDYSAWGVVTISKSLALSIRTLAETLGYGTTLYRWSNKPTKQIEGRTIRQSPYTYQLRISTYKRRTYFRDELHSWYNVSEIELGGETKVVYNMTVENDNSYIADGIVVHNCQDLSMAGKRAGLGGERSGLFMEAVRIIKEMREKTNGRFPTVAIWENVPGAFSSNRGEDFRVVLEEMCRIKDSSAAIPRPASGGGGGVWADAGSILADGYSVAWRILDAQYWGVPQRRRRIFLVADFAGQRAEEILFKSDGLQRSFAESRKSWQGITDNLEGSIRTSGGGIALESHPQDSRVKISEDGKVQTMAANMGLGGGNVPLTMQVRCGCEGGAREH